MDTTISMLCTWIIHNSHDCECIWTTAINSVIFDVHTTSCLLMRFRMLCVETVFGCRICAHVYLISFWLRNSSYVNGICFMCKFTEQAIQLHATVYNFMRVCAILENLWKLWKSSKTYKTPNKLTTQLNTCKNVKHTQNDHTNPKHYKHHKPHKTHL